MISTQSDFVILYFSGTACQVNDSIIHGIFLLTTHIRSEDKKNINSQAMNTTSQLLTHWCNKYITETATIAKCS